MGGLKRLFSEGFRIFFLAGCLFGLAAMLVWVGWLATQARGGVLDLPTAWPANLWHGHEMIIGYAGATLGGFLLTSASGGTGPSGLPHRFVALVFGLWLLGRVAVWNAALLPAPVVALADLSYLPVLGSRIALNLMARPKLQQALLLVIVALVWTSNLSFHLGGLGLLTDGASRGVRGALLAHSAMLLIIGGRLVPGFTRNAMMQAGQEQGHPQNPAALAVLSIAPGLALVPAVLAGAPAGAIAALALMAGGAALLRLLFWRGWWAWSRPILWTLHLAFLLNGLGLVAFGLWAAGVGDELAALHLIGIGGIGGITLSILTRLTLGLTGRPLVAPWPVAVAYALIPLAAVIRFVASTWPEIYYPASLTAGALWLLAFGLVLAALWPVFLGPRLPRAPVLRQPGMPRG